MNQEKLKGFILFLQEVDKSYGKIKQVDNLLELNKKQDKIIKELKNENKWIKRQNIMLSSLLEKHNGIVICTICGGEGGFETEAGGEPCSDCGGNGYVISK